MPQVTVNGKTKHFPYTKEGKAAAIKAHESVVVKPHTSAYVSDPKRKSVQIKPKRRVYSAAIIEKARAAYK